MSGAPEGTDRQAVLKQALHEIKQMRARVEASERAKREPIAILGMACRFPGADSPEAFWRLLRDGVDATSEVPPERWDVDAWYDPDPNAPGKAYTRRGGFLRDVDRFDARFFNINPREAVSIDPQHRLFWEQSWEALERAGRAPGSLSGSRAGVFLGITNNDYGQLLATLRDPAEQDGYVMTGNALNFAPGRLSYMLGLQGPSVAVDTACSSSLVALHLACQSLRSGEVDLAIVGGVNLILSPGGTVLMSKARALAPDGRCKTFDASADGYARGEGCGVVVLARLSDAVAAKDPILAVIRGSAVNQDGPSSGPTVPNGQAQQAVIREALARAGVKPTEVDYVEAHGTGTSLGDPIELRALGEVLGEGRAAGDRFVLGSVKTNVGHAEAAAGMAGLLKVVLSLRHGQIPPHLHFRVPNPHVPWESIPAEVRTSLSAWTRRGERRVAGVSSFGASGTNAHVVLSEPPPTEATATEPEPRWAVLPLSARRWEALLELAGRFEEHLANNPSTSLGEVCATAATGRTHFSHRLAVVADSVSEVRSHLAAFVAGEPAAGLVAGRTRGETPPKVAFLFTGQGSQYVGMGRGLYESQPVFRQTLDRCDALLRPLMERPLLEVLFAKEGVAEAELLTETRYTQPALFALEYALAELWRSWGVVPQAVLGHSVGELVAACVAGVFSLEDGLKLIAERARLMHSLPRDGEMAAVFAGEAEVAESLRLHEGRVSLAAINGPTETVISGERQAVLAVVESFQGKGIKTRALQVSHAFHSPLMESILEPFERVAEKVTYAAPKLTVISNVTGRPATAAELTGAAYWKRHVREPVRFLAGVQSLHEAGIGLMVELGPKPTLLGMAKRCVPEDAGAGWIPSLREGQNETRTVLEAVSELYTRGVEVDWKGLVGTSRRRVTLPTYPFQRERYWVEPSARAAGATPMPAMSARGGHPLIGHRVRSPVTVAFETQLDAGRLAVLRDHRVHGHIVVSGVVHLSMAMAAMAEVSGASPGVHAEGITFSDALLLSEGEPRTVQLVLQDKGQGGTAFQLFSLEAGQGGGEPSWKLHTSGTFQGEAREGAFERARVEGPLDAVRARCGEEMTGEAFYATHWKVGEHEIGPSFRLIRRLWRRDGEALAEISVPEMPELSGERTALPVGPLLAEACVVEACGQLVKVALPAGVGERGVFIGVGVDRHDQRHGGAGRTRWCHVRLHPSEDPDSLRADLRLLDEVGAVVAVSEGMHLRRVSAQVLRRAVEGPSRATTVSRRQEPVELLERIRSASAAEKRGHLESYLLHQAASVSGLAASDIDPEASLRELGLDSLGAVDLKGWIQKDLGVDVPVADLLQGPSPRHLAEQLAQSLTPIAAPVTESPRRTPPPGDPIPPEELSRWFRRKPGATGARVRLFCFPFGGAGALVYRGWAEKLPHWLEVIPVQLPGREERLKERAFERFPALLPELARVMRPLLDEPFALFGASMGGIIAFELARWLRAEWGLEPAHLFIAASSEPQVPNARLDEMLGAVVAGGSKVDVGLLRRFNLVPEALLAYPEMVQMLLPTMQADFRLLRSHVYRNEAPFDCPISIFGGTRDTLVGREHLEAWGQHTRGVFKLRLFEGEHLFVKNDPGPVQAAIAEDLSERFREG
ncbi:acyltransferase domain-containing protein [Archangium violaceum]|uniref:type I polyketide synthase n=1 Tax=Archangium violaceum TaxID=83451 RepID=UPI00193B1550|nr:type I polyketide synthase [Archangium violaceum]QRK05997.1 acyltransferase domain-containing protein [Archangium violaceum]